MKKPSKFTVEDEKALEQLMDLMRVNFKLKHGLLPRDALYRQTVQQVLKETRDKINKLWQVTKPHGVFEK